MVYLCITKKKGRAEILALLVDPGSHGVLVLAESFWEPQGDLLLGALDGIGSMNHVSANVDAVVSTDGSRLRSQWVGRSDDLTSGLYDILTLEKKL